MPKRKIKMGTSPSEERGGGGGDTERKLRKRNFGKTRERGLVTRQPT
jgi:hypothetical protein